MAEPVVTESSQEEMRKSVGAVINPKAFFRS
jgi:hypothetical protein